MVIFNLKVWDVRSEAIIVKIASDFTTISTLDELFVLKTSLYNNYITFLAYNGYEDISTVEKKIKEYNKNTKVFYISNKGLSGETYNKYKIESGYNFYEVTPSMGVKIIKETILHAHESLGETNSISHSVANRCYWILEEGYGLHKFASECKAEGVILTGGRYKHKHDEQFYRLSNFFRSVGIREINLNSDHRNNNLIQRVYKKKKKG